MPSSLSHKPSANLLSHLLSYFFKTNSIFSRPMQTISSLIFRSSDIGMLRYFCSYSLRYFNALQMIFISVSSSVFVPSIISFLYPQSVVKWNLHGHHISPPPVLQSGYWPVSYGLHCSPNHAPYPSNSSLHFSRHAVWLTALKALSSKQHREKRIDFKYARTVTTFIQC